MEPQKRSKIVCTPPSADTSTMTKPKRLQIKRSATKTTTTSHKNSEELNHSQAVVSSAHGVRLFRLGEGLPDLEELRDELDEMTSTLVGHQDPPMNVGVGTLMEVASSYFARAMEITALIQRGETDGHIPRGSKLYKFRTGELRSFMDLAKNATEMGSRRITIAQLQSQYREGW